MAFSSQEYNLAEIFPRLPFQSATDPNFAQRFEDTLRSLPYQNLGNWSLIHMLDWITEQLQQRFDPSIRRTLLYAQKQATRTLSTHTPKHLQALRLCKMISDHKIYFGDDLMLSALENIMFHKRGMAPDVYKIFKASADADLVLPPHLLKYLTGYYRQNLETVSLGTLTNTLHALVALQLRGIDYDFSPLVEAINTRLLAFNLDSFYTDFRHQLHDIQIITDAPVVYFDREGDEMVSTSHTERKFIALLENSGAHTVPDHQHISGMQHSVDAAIRWKGDLILFEVDGPGHFIWQAGDTDLVKRGYNASTLVQSALLTKTAPQHRIIRIDFDHVGMLNKSPWHVDAFLDAAAQLPYGIFKTLSGDENSSITMEPILSDFPVDHSQDFTRPPILTATASSPEAVDLPCELKL